MGIYGRSLFKSASDTSLYVRREKQSRITAKSTDRLDALKDSLARGKCSSDTKFKERLLDKIFEDSSSADESEKDFKDFIQIFSYSKVNLKKGFFLSKSSVTDRFDSVREKILNKSVKLDVSIQKKMNYRSSSASRNTSACFYPCDFYTRRKKREPKSYMHVNSFNHSFDNPSKYRFNRQRSLSPNLPKIPYLEKPPQYTTHPLISSQRKSRIIFKDKSCKDRQKVNRNASKKSIPEHALMKNLLSGLSIFENEDVDVVGSHTKNFHKHKSMGNIKSSTTENYILKSNYKSDVDFRDSIAGNPEEAVENFKGYCNSYKRTCPKRYEFQDYRCSGNGNCVNGERNINISKEREDQKFQRRNTLVERRKNFFENRKKQMELENVKLKPTTLVISCVGRQIQNDDEKSDDITEIYRNFHSVHSTSTISKRSSSLPPLSRFRRSNGRNGSELFNPDYNFCCENSTGARNSIIETIRSKVFQTNNNAKKECTDKWNSEPTYIPKFPKETRTAMSIILSNKNSSVSCKFCREKFHRKQLVHIETQTSPQISRHKILQSSGDVPKLPCPKNLLCDKGYHPGKCEESIRRKLNVVCDEHCVCRENRRMLEFGYGVIWPGQAVRLRKNLDSEQSPSEDFLGLIRPDLDISEEKLDYQHQRIHELSTPSQPSITMNGLNGHANGDLNGCGDIITQNQQRGCWTIGLINSKYRYLTAETFGFKINANGASLKKKQIWTLEPDTSSGSETCVYLKSHLDKYLAVDSFGNVTCESEEKEPGSKFQVTVSEDNTGRWAFRNVVRGYFLGSSSDKLTCTAKAPGDTEYWLIHLAARPQVNLRSVGRKRFAHLSENLDEIHVDANIPWGEDTLFTLEFHADEDGKYALHTCNNKYLSNGGKLVDTCNKDCLFSAEYHSGQLALRDRNGQYLSPIGSKAVLKTRSNTVTKDELFSLEDSLPQASFVAALNSRYVSVKQGVDVTANQDEILDHETFQLEFDWSTKRWYIRTMQDKYWTLETGGGIQASGDKRSSNALFDLVWQGDGSLAFRANNGRYVMTKRSGHLYATSDVIDDNCKYYFYLINRPILVLKCEQGFVGYKSASSPKLECNKASYECIQVVRAEKGIIHFKGQNGKYWHVDSEGVTADSDTPEGFYLELREPTRLCIKTANGNYLTASKNGLFRLGDSNIENATQWEY